MSPGPSLTFTRLVILSDVCITCLKPMRLQWVNPAVLKISGPDSLLDGLSGGLEVKGTIYNEATFIS
jgi:hypothetical protein